MANTITAKRDELIDDLLAWFDSIDAQLPEDPNPTCGAEAHREADREARSKN